MINTGSQEKAPIEPISAQERRPHDILYEESVLTLTDSEFTSMDSSSGVSKKRRVVLADKPRNVVQIRSQAQDTSP